MLITLGLIIQLSNVDYVSVVDFELSLLIMLTFIHVVLCKFMCYVGIFKK